MRRGSEATAAMKETQTDSQTRLIPHRAGGHSAPLPISLVRRRGRPRKFTGPSRAVTLRLPESVLSALASVHHDISTAVVHLTERRLGKKRQPLAELAVFGRNAVITVRPTPSLERGAGVKLVPLPGGRA